jgi:hypothetical protein
MAERPEGVAGVFLLAGNEFLFTIRCRNRAETLGAD